MPQKTKKPRNRNVSKPVAAIPVNKHSAINIYVLPTERHRFRRPARKGHNAEWQQGPCLVIEKVKGQERITTVHPIDSGAAWRFFGELMAVGKWALDSKKVAPHLPEQFLSLATRFEDRTHAELVQMAARLRGPSR